MKHNNCVIPSKSKVFQTLKEVAATAKVVVFSGLPGVGKSLYINQFQIIAAAEGREVTVIQWDIARKAFETPKVFTHFPMGNGVIHNGVKLSVGKWLMDTVKNWLETYTEKEQLLLIEAPLVGHRFIELAKINDDPDFEAFLKSKAFQAIVPIPTKEVREKIEADRKAQVADNAKTWVGAKPAVMLMLWKMICGIANEFGRSIPMDGQPAYDPEVYEFVFAKILKHRHFIPLHVNDIYPVEIVDENDLHNTGSLAADPKTANHYCDLILENYPSQRTVDTIVNAWYKT